MGEAIWTRVRVKTPTTWTEPWFMEQLDEIIYDGDGIEVEAADDHLVWVIAGLANYGHYAYEAELAWLRANRIPYDVHDDGKYEFAPEAEFFDGVERWTAVTGHDGEAILDADDFRAIVNRTRGEVPVADLTCEHLNTIVADVAAHFRRLEWHVEAADISHLPDTCPSEDSPVEVALL